MIKEQFMQFAPRSVHPPAGRPRLISSTNSPTALDNTRHMNDAQLVEACLSGDERAWELLLERYGRLVYTIPLRFNFPPQVADEIFQEVSFILFEKLKTLQDRQRLHPWIVTITRRACVQRMRNASPSTISIDEIGNAGRSNEETIEEQLLKSEQQSILYQAMMGLDGRSQYLLKALFFSEKRFSYSEIAHTLNVPVGSIGPLRSRCLKKLCDEMMKLEEGNGN